MHIHVLTSHSCIFLCWIPPWRWQRKAETCRGLPRFVCRI